MKRNATLLLVFFAIVFVVARLLESRWPWMGFIRATANVIQPRTYGAILTFDF